MGEGGKVFVIFAAALARNSYLTESEGVEGKSMRRPTLLLCVVSTMVSVVLSPGSAGASRTLLPAAPVITSVIPSDSAVTLSWSSQAKGILGYQVSAKVKGSSLKHSCVVSPKRLGNSIGTCTVAHLVNFKTATLSVAVITAAGTSRSSISSTIPGVVPPKPSITLATSTTTTATVEWSSPSKSAGSSNVSYVATATADEQRPISCLAKTFASSTSKWTCRFSGLSEATKYLVSVSGQNSFGLGPAALTPITTQAQVPSSTPSAEPHIPDPPVIGKVSTTVNSVTVTWLAGANGGSAITSFMVSATRGADAPRTCSMLSFTSGGGSCTWVGLSGGSSYLLRISAVNARGASAPILQFAVPRDHVISSLHLSKTWVTPGSSLGLNGTGFLAGSNVDFSISRSASPHQGRMAHVAGILGSDTASIDGTVASTVVVPVNLTDQGAYTVTAFGTDDLGNPTTVVNEVAIGFDSSVPVLDGPNGDNPLSITTALGDSTIDTSSGPATVRLRVGISDDLSGIKQLEFNLYRFPLNVGNSYLSPRSCLPDLVPGTSVMLAGNVVHGVYTCDLTVPQYWGPTSYVCFSASDNAANYFGCAGDITSQGQVGYSATDLRISNLSSEVATAPVLNGPGTPGELTTSTTQFNVANGPVDVTYTLGFHKPLLAPQQINISYSHRDPVTGVVTSMVPSQGFPQLTLISGTAEDGIWQWTQTFSSRQSAGTYECPILTITDGLQSYTYRGCGTWGQAGFASYGYDDTTMGVIVTDALVYNGPQLVAANQPGHLSCSPSSIDTSQGAASVSCSLTMKVDPGIDPAFVLAVVTFRTGADVCTAATGECTNASYASGALRFVSANSDGTVNVSESVVFPAHSAAGIWQLIQVSLGEGMIQVGVWPSQGLLPKDLAELGYDLTALQVVNASQN